MNNHKAIISKVFEIANNAIYFNDSSDYKSALYEIAVTSKPEDLMEDAIGEVFIDEGCTSEDGSAFVDKETSISHCPHCGPGNSQVTLYKTDYNFWTVGCGACGSHSGIHKDKKKVVDSWNSRA